MRLREDISEKEETDFCISKCGEGYCDWRKGQRDGLAWPCQEYQCFACSLAKEVICDFCRGSDAYREAHGPMSHDEYRGILISIVDGIQRVADSSSSSNTRLVEIRKLLEKSRK